MLSCCKIHRVYIAFSLVQSFELIIKGKNKTPIGFFSPHVFPKSHDVHVLWCSNVSTKKIYYLDFQLLKYGLKQPKLVFWSICSPSLAKVVNLFPKPDQDDVSLVYPAFSAFLQTGFIFSSSHVQNLFKTINTDQINQLGQSRRPS